MECIIANLSNAVRNSNAFESYVVTGNINTDVIESLLCYFFNRQALVDGGE